MAERTTAIAADAISLMHASYDPAVRALAQLYDAWTPDNRDYVVRAFPTIFDEFAQKAARARTQSRAA